MSTTTETEAAGRTRPPRAASFPTSWSATPTPPPLFYQRAFGAEEVARMPVPSGDGRLMHCHMSTSTATR